nr:helix-turn-helix transcriptional regulator [uncultured Flavonifractor sp.]
MDEKKTFGAYIRRKRGEAGLTQRELAQALYVTESSVSKWERGLSYPDVSLVPSICRLLHISEHEFFTACDDDEASAQARAAAVWNRVVRGVRIFFAAAYLAALVPCFICNLVFERGLSWFWIVFFSLGMAFCVTNLPFRLKKNKLPICMGGLSVCLLLLLLACWGVTGGPWLGSGLAITAACLSLPWGLWAIHRFYSGRCLPIFMALLTVWLFVLLAVISLTTGGDWLFSLGYPIATFVMALVWLLFVILYWLPVGPWLKGGLAALEAAFVVPLSNCLSAWLVPEQKVPGMAHYFSWQVLVTHADVEGFSWINVLVFAIMLLTALALVGVGVGLELRRLRRKRDHNI